MASKNRITQLINLGILQLFLFSFAQAQTTFKMPTRPYGAVIVDYDLDGDNDVVVGCSGIISTDIDSIVIMFNDGWGNFVLEGFEANSGIFIYCADMTNDGYPDIISRDADSIFFHENDQNGGIGEQYNICHTIGNRRIGGIADMDTNGYLDVVYYSIQVLGGWGVAYNNNGYTFNDIYSYYTEDNEYIAVGNLNSDNLEDVLVTNLSSPEVSYAMYNQIDTFQKEIISERLWYTPYIFDINNDNQNEAVLEYLSSVHYIDSWLYFFQSDEYDGYLLVDSTRIHGGNKIGGIADFDQDGYLDIVLTVSSWESDPSEDSVYIYRNNQHWGFELQDSHYIAPWFYPDVIPGDLNEDGYPDAVTIGYLNPNADYIQLLWNDRKGHFIDTNNVYVHIEEDNMEGGIKLYPNPTNGRIIVTSKDYRICEITIYNLEGQELIKENGIFSKKKTLSLNNRFCKTNILICAITLENSEIIYRKIINKKPN